MTLAPSPTVHWLTPAELHRVEASLAAMVAEAEPPAEQPVNEEGVAA